MSSFENVTYDTMTRHVWGYKNTHKSGRSLIHCCWTACPFTPLL